MAERKRSTCFAGKLVIGSALGRQGQQTLQQCNSFVGDGVRADGSALVRDSLKAHRDEAADIVGRGKPWDDAL
jgi:hypothetical protein